MGSRTIERGMARALYDDFSRQWRKEKRLAGKEGMPGYRKPSFGQWHRMHLRDHEMMRDSTPVDVQEYLGIDPWAEMSGGPSNNGDTEPDARGVPTVPIG